MEFSNFQLLSPWHHMLSSLSVHSHQTNSGNHVHWSQTPESHVYSAGIPGVRKEEIKVEVEDAKYLIIRTEGIDETTQPVKKFMRRFRLPRMVNIDGISAGYQNGVLTVTVPRFSSRGGFSVEPVDLGDRIQVAARAA